MNTILTRLSSEQIQQYVAAGFWGSETLYQLVRGHTLRAPESAALRDRFRVVRYRELLTAADILAADLARHGVRPGQRVAVWLPSRIESAVALLACARNGYVCCPSLHRDHTIGAVLELMRRIRCVAMIWQSGYGADADRNDYAHVLHKVSTLRHLYRLEPASEKSSLVPSGTTPTDDLAQPERSDPNQVVYLAFTSGSTGSPKAVMHSDNTLLANARQMAKDLSLDSEAVILSLSPLSHNLGFGAQVMALAIGAELVVNDLARGASLADRIVETRTSFLVGVPPHAVDLLSEMKSRDLNGLGRLKGFRISGAAVPREVVAGLIERGVVPQSGYGMTESCSHQYTLPDDPPERIIETSGRTCPGYELRIFKADDPETEAMPGEIGEIGGRGASLMLGYFNDQAATEDAFKSGWFMTGDLGTLDSNGYLRITGRSKDIIVRGGHNIHPARIEQLASRHAAVRRAAAVPVKDDRLGEKVCLVVACHEGNALTPADLLAHLDAVGLSRYEMPEYYLVVEEIPLTPNGKVLKRDIVEQIRDGRLVPEPIRFETKVQSRN
jgi:acyl-CoA synthetase (AMP-forming)/AMP-acid ligase II